MKNIRLPIATAAVAILAVSCSSYAPKVRPGPAVPDAIKVPATGLVDHVLTARGVQNYECTPRQDDATKYEWAFKTQEADLFDASGKVVGRHFDGTTWESTDGSKVVGEIRSRAEAKDGNAIPWLLISAKKNEGDGVFTDVIWIQRVDTVGGKAPAGGCDQGSVGSELRVPYTAVFWFYSASK